MKTFQKEQLDSIYSYLLKHNRPFRYSSDGHSYTISSAADAEREMNQALEQGNYALVKDLNHILAFFDLAEERTVFRHRPMVMQLEHTSYCNAECIMCIHYYKQNQDAVHLSGELYEKLRPALPYLEEIVLHGNGEPFLLPNIGEVLAEYKKYGIRVSTNTNMSVLPESVLTNIDVFKALTVSIDSPRKEIYDVIRKRLDFNRVTENIDKLRSAAPDLHMTLAVVSMRQNIRDSKMLVEYAAKHGFNRIIFSRLGVNGYIKNWFDDVMHYPATTRRCMQEAVDYANSIGMEVVYPEVFLTLEGGDEALEIEKMDSYPTAYSEEQLCELREQVAKMPKKGDFYYDEFNLIPSPFRCRGICDLIWNNIMITAKGEVVVCCIDVLHHIDILDKPIDEIWNGEKYVALRSMFLEQRLLPEFCRNCMFILNHGLRYLSVEIGDGFYRNKKKTN